MPHRRRGTIVKAWLSTLLLVFVDHLKLGVDDVGIFLLSSWGWTFRRVGLGFSLGRRLLVEFGAYLLELGLQGIKRPLEFVVVVALESLADSGDRLLYGLFRRAVELVAEVL